MAGINLIEAAFERFGKVVTSSMHVLGADPVAEASGNLTMRFFGKGFSVSGKTPIPVPNKAADQGMGLMGTVTSLLALGGAGVSLSMGYSDNGLAGAVHAASWEMASSAAIIKYGYNRKLGSNGITQISPRGIGFGLAGRSMLSSSVGYMVGSSIGGFPGWLAGMGAAYYTGKHAGKMTAFGALAGAGYLAGKGTSAIYKAGYRHQQMKRGIDTAGSLAAFETQGAYTMRERAVQAIHKSQMNARSALGQEAAFMHTNKNYTSMYRM
jgi:hypothetical protein